MRSMVEGATVVQDKTVNSAAPSTALRAVPLPRCAGEEG
jgi:hypothetical protein